MVGLGFSRAIGAALAAAAFVQLPAQAQPAAAQPAPQPPAQSVQAPAQQVPAQQVPPAIPDAALRSLVVLEFELVDEQNNPLTKAAQEVRLRNAGLQLQQELAERRLYRVVDPAPTAQLQRDLRLQQEYLYRCDDCAAQVGRLANADLVMQTWVQKVSELILNLNVQIYDVSSGKVVFTKSVDMRGNDDVSWSRAVRFLVRDMAEKRERNPKYGL